MVVGLATTLHLTCERRPRRCTTHDARRRLLYTEERLLAAWWVKSKYGKRGEQIRYRRRCLAVLLLQRGGLHEQSLPRRPYHHRQHAPHRRVHCHFEWHTHNQPLFSNLTYDECRCYCLKTIYEAMKPFLKYMDFILKCTIKESCKEILFLINLLHSLFISSDNDLIRLLFFFNIIICKGCFLTNGQWLWTKKNKRRIFQKMVILHYCLMLSSSSSKVKAKRDEDLFFCHSFLVLIHLIEV